MPDPVLDNELLTGGIQEVRNPRDFGIDVLGPDKPAFDKLPQSDKEEILNRFYQSDYESNPNFKALPLSDQTEVRDKLFNTYAPTNTPLDFVQGLRDQFLQQASFGLYDAPKINDNTASNIGGTIGNIGGGISNVLAGGFAGGRAGAALGLLGGPFAEISVPASAGVGAILGAGLGAFGGNVRSNLDQGLDPNYLRSAIEGVASGAGQAILPGSGNFIQKAARGALTQGGISGLAEGLGQLTEGPLNIGNIIKSTALGAGFGLGNGFINPKKNALKAQISNIPDILAESSGLGLREKYQEILSLIPKIQGLDDRDRLNRVLKNIKETYNKIQEEASGLDLSQGDLNALNEADRNLKRIYAQAKEDLKNLNPKPVKKRVILKQVKPKNIDRLAKVVLKLKETNRGNELGVMLSRYDKKSRALLRDRAEQISKEIRDREITTKKAQIEKAKIEAARRSQALKNLTTGSNKEDLKALKAQIISSNEKRIEKEKIEAARRSQALKNLTTGSSKEDLEALKAHIKNKIKPEAGKKLGAKLTQKPAENDVLTKAFLAKATNRVLKLEAKAEISGERLSSTYKNKSDIVIDIGVSNKGEIYLRTINENGQLTLRYLNSKSGSKILSAKISNQKPKYRYEDGKVFDTKTGKEVPQINETGVISSELEAQKDKLRRILDRLDNEKLSVAEFQNLIKESKEISDSSIVTGLKNNKVGKKKALKKSSRKDC